MPRNNQEIDFRQQRKKRYPINAPQSHSEPSIVSAVETGMPWQWEEGGAFGLPDDFCYNPSNNIVEEPVDKQQQELALAYEASKQSKQQSQSHSQLPPPPATVPKNRSQRSQHSQHSQHSQRSKRSEQSQSKKYQKFTNRYGQESYQPMDSEPPTRETSAMIPGLTTLISFLDHEESTNDSRTSSVTSPPTIHESRPVTDVELASYTDLGSSRFFNEYHNSSNSRNDTSPSPVPTYMIESMLEDEYQDDYDEDDEFRKKKRRCKAPPCTCCFICLLIIGGILLGYYQFDKFGQGSKNVPVSVTADNSNQIPATRVPIKPTLAPTEAPTEAPTILDDLVLESTLAATSVSTSKPAQTNAPSGEVNGNETGVTATTPVTTDSPTSDTPSPTTTEVILSSEKSFNVTAAPTPSATTDMPATPGPTTGTPATPEPTSSPPATSEPTTSPTTKPDEVIWPAQTKEPETEEPTTNSPTFQPTTSSPTITPVPTATPPQMTLRNIRVYVSNHFHIYGTESIRPQIKYRGETYFPWKDFKWFYPYENIEIGAWYPLEDFDNWCHPTSGCSGNFFSPEDTLELSINVRDDADVDSVMAFGWTIDPETWFYPELNYETNVAFDPLTGKFLKWKFDIVELTDDE